MSVIFLLLVCVIKTVTSQPTTMAPPSGEWTIEDSAGNVCMRMSFAAQYTVITESPPVHVHIDPSTAVVTSDCASPFRALNIDTKYGSPYNDNWKLHLYFMRTSQKYNMTRIYVEWNSEDSGAQGTEGITDNYLDLSVDLGKAYTCSRPLNVNINNKASVEILDMDLQPFAEYSSGEFGPSENCVRPPPTGNTAFIIALSSVGGVLLITFVVVVIAALVYLSRRRRYQTIQ